MNVKLLIDGIVRQTTVLIAQLSTAAGIRAPLAHVADQVFLQLAREIEAQGVGRKVVADMFGLAIRSYQTKMQRLTESESQRDKTLWQAILDYLASTTASREQVLHRFQHDPEREVVAILNDLVNSGICYRTGRGRAAVYGLATEDARRAVLRQDELDSVANFLWLTVHLEEPIRREVLLARHADLGAQASRAIDLLLQDGRLSSEADGSLRASNFFVAAGSEQGWEEPCSTTSRPWRRRSPPRRIRRARATQSSNAAEA
jgi:hypothetical protein